MKNILLTIALVLLLIGCVSDGTQEQTSQDDQENQELEEQKTIDYDVQKILDNYKNVKSYEFQYHSNLNERQTDHYYVKLPYVKVELTGNNKFETNRITAVYMDVSKKTAVAYCEDNSPLICPDKGRAYDVSYDDYMKILPHEWIQNIDYAEKEGYKTVESRDTSILGIERAGKEYTIDIDDFFGIPVGARIGTTEYKYTDLAANNLNDKDVRPV